MSMNPRRALPLAFLLLPLSGAGLAQDGGWRIGVGAVMEGLDTRYDKSVVNGPGSPRGEGNVFRGPAESDATMHGLALALEYRTPVGGRGLWLSGALRFGHFGGAVTGTTEETGNAPGRNEYGEHWGENWSYRMENGYGLIFRLGGSPDAAPDIGLYGLAGAVRTDTMLDVNYFGCFSDEPCNSANLEPGVVIRETAVSGWTAGVGVERRFGERIAVRGELRHTDYGTDHWESYVDPADPDKVRVPVNVDSDRFGLTLGVIFSF